MGYVPIFHDCSRQCLRQRQLFLNESNEFYGYNFSYDIGFNGRVIFDAVPDAACERTLNEAVILHVDNTERWFTLSAKAIVIR